ncbi:hypothetical protein [Dactylosporangium sp. CA-092794]|uniref:hypothetical protein n=1 Tax=Dactylosporangium sp. CA-092794 TaxID=3239929 RepID=UPI003D8FD994
MSAAEHDADLAALRERPGPFGLTYFVHAYAESDTRALVNALWVLRHSRAGAPAVAVLAAELLEFYGRRFRGMYGLSDAAAALDTARDALLGGASAEAVLAGVAARIGELNFRIDEGIPPAALAEAFAAADAQESG